MEPAGGDTAARDTMNDDMADRAHDRPEPSEAEIDSTLADSFPASDPPSWTRGLEQATARKEAPDEK